MNIKPRISQRLNKQSFLLILMCFALLLPSIMSSAVDTPITVRVGLVSMGKPSSITIYCTSPFQIVDAASKSVIREVDSQDVTFSAKDKGVAITIEDKEIGQFSNAVRLTTDDGLFEIKSPKARYTKYRRVLEIIPGSSLTVVNELPLEDYVKGVIPVEAPKNFQVEAQKALTVAIRTYALKNVQTSKRHISSGYNLCDTTDCKGFAGVSREADWSNKLADDTRGQIAVYDGKPIWATYSSDCGGSTQSGEDAGFGKDSWPYLRTTPDGVDADCDSYCSGSPVHSWNKKYTVDELGCIFSKYPSLKIGKFASMEFAEYDTSGRVKTVLLKGDAGESRITGNKLRQMFGVDTMKSSLMMLTITPEGDYSIDGKGYGHGTGICAFGANGMAKAKPGVTYIDILKHYYTGIEVTNSRGSSTVCTTPRKSGSLIPEGRMATQ